MTTWKYKVTVTERFAVIDRSWIREEPDIRSSADSMGRVDDEKELGTCERDL
jgi:hypothetical protein